MPLMFALLAILAISAMPSGALAEDPNAESETSQEKPVSGSETETDEPADEPGSVVEENAITEDNDASPPTVRTTISSCQKFPAIWMRYRFPSVECGN